MLSRVAKYMLQFNRSCIISRGRYGKLVQHSYLQSARGITNIANDDETGSAKGKASINNPHVILSSNPRYLEVKYENGKHDLYPYIFLRDNCQCEKCFDEATKQRVLDTIAEVPLDIRPDKVEVSSDNSDIVLTWPDGHVSKFSRGWLESRSFPKLEKDIKSKSKYGLAPCLWDGDLEGKISQHEFCEMMRDDSAALNWLQTLATTGLALIKNAPPKPGVLFDHVRKLLGKYIRRTHYGEVFCVKQKPDPSNLAYTSNCLPLHVDLPFLDYQPGIQMLHCIKQASGGGGENHFVDGFTAAAQLREHEPELFEILSTVKFVFNDIGSDEYGEFNMAFERPIIGLDEFGNVESISMNNHVRSSFVNAPVDKVYDSYKAYYALSKALRDAKNRVTYKMKAGDIVTFDNRRVLHGRAAYSLTSERHLEGCYFDWDEANSAIRVLRKRLGIAGGLF
eukprot:gene15681-17262_t